MTKTVSRLVALTAALVASVTAAHAAVIISTAKTQHMTCASGVCAPTSKKAVLNVTDLAAMLASGDVIVTTGSGAVSIAVTDTFSWTSSHRLTLGAQQSVSFRAAVQVAGTGAVTITSGAGEAPAFFTGGSLDFWDTSSSLIINGAPYTLVADIKTLAADIAANAQGFYALANNYDASHEAYYNAAVATGFSGTFDGLGHDIDSFSVTSRTAPGAAFFNAVGGTVRDLSFTNASAKTSKVAASIVALENSGTISHVAAQGQVAVMGSRATGSGFVWENSGTIDSSTMSGSVVLRGARSVAGGFVAGNSGIITNSHSAASVTASLAGGFAPGNNGTISLSSASGAVTAAGNTNEYFLAAGFVAVNEAVIDQSFATGNVVSAGGISKYYFAQAGGFVAIQYGPGTITNSYATGSVSVGPVGRAGGFAQQADAVSSSWSSGAVSAADPNSAAGFSYAPPSDGASDYWDIDTSGQSAGCGFSCPGVTGLSTAQFQSGLPAGFDPAIWAESAGINNGYPYLIANPPQ